MELMQLNDGRVVKNPQDWQKRRQEILALLSREEYGYSPAVLSPAQGRVVHENTKCCAGHAVLETIEITAETEKGAFSFPVRLLKPTREGRHPLFLLLNFRPDEYDMYFPAEEIIDRGYALAVIDYQSITTDNGDWENGLAAHFTRPEDGTGYGKIGLWAWGASRALDYLLTRVEIDPACVAVVGHSRLGKTALWCAAQDERIQFAFSNDSGCAGAALENTRHAGGETTADIVKVFPYWFCENYHKYAHETMPFDQHFLLAAIAPRFVGVGSASLDLWADPYSEQLCCAAASPAWETLGLDGYIGPTEPAQCGDHFAEGHVGYHLRHGTHFLSRTDWLRYMAFVDDHRSSLKS